MQTIFPKQINKNRNNNKNRHMSAIQKWFPFYKHSHLQSENRQKIKKKDNQPMKVHFGLKVLKKKIL